MITQCVRTDVVGACPEGVPSALADLMMAKYERIVAEGATPDEAFSQLMESENVGPNLPPWVPRAVLDNDAPREYIHIPPAGPPKAYPWPAFAVPWDEKVKKRPTCLHDNVLHDADGVYGKLGVVLVTDAEHVVGAKHNRFLNGFGDMYLVVFYSPHTQTDFHRHNPGWKYRKAGFPVPEDMWPKVMEALGLQKHVYHNPLAQRLNEVFRQALDWAKAGVTSERFDRLQNLLSLAMERCTHPHVEVLPMSCGEFAGPFPIPRSQEGLTHVLKLLQPIFMRACSHVVNQPDLLPAANELQVYSFPSAEMSMETESLLMATLLLPANMQARIREETADSEYWSVVGQSDELETRIKQLYYKDVGVANPTFTTRSRKAVDYGSLRVSSTPSAAGSVERLETKEERAKRNKRAAKRLRKLRKRELDGIELPARAQAPAAGPRVRVLRTTDPEAQEYLAFGALCAQLNLQVQLRKARARFRQRCEARRQRRLTVQRALRKALWRHYRKLRYDQLAWEEGAPEREKERRRKEQAAAGRARNKAGQGNTLPSDTLPRPQPGAKPGKDRAVVRTDAQQSAHETWADPSEREGRRQKFDAKQQAAADQAVADKAEATKSAARAAEIAQGKKQADRFKHAASPLDLGAFVQQPETHLKSLKDWSPPKADPPSPEEEDVRSVMSVATSNWPMPTPSNHAVQRAAEHGATQRQLQRTMKHGPVEMSAHGTEDAPRLVHRGEAGGFDVVTDATGEVAITTHPARASQARARASP